MPPTTPEYCHIDYVARRVVAFDPLRVVCDAQGCKFPDPSSKKERGSTWSSADTGEYELTLPVGKYSLFLEEPAGSFYANSYTSDGDWVEPIEIRFGERVERDLEINYATD